MIGNRFFGKKRPIYLQESEDNSNEHKQQPNTLQEVSAGRVFWEVLDIISIAPSFFCQVMEWFWVACSTFTIKAVSILDVDLSIHYYLLHHYVMSSYNVTKLYSYQKEKECISRLTGLLLPLKDYLFCFFLYVCIANPFCRSG